MSDNGNLKTWIIRSDGVWNTAVTVVFALTKEDAIATANYILANNNLRPYSAATNHYPASVIELPIVANTGELIDDGDM